jgi:holo-[acyl-carrier protein] synthase
MIAGIGADIVAIARLLRFLARHGQAAVEKILSEEEARLFSDRFGDAISVEGMPARDVKSEDSRHLRAAAAFLAKRFAAKEALAKAFGTGLRSPLEFSAITVRNDGLGRPFFAYAPELAKWVEEKRLAAHLSLSDERDFALAFVVLESESGCRETENF